MKFSEVFEEKIWNASNILTMTRMILLPVYVWLGGAYREDPGGPMLWVLLSLISGAVISDFLDGFLARKLHQITKLGQYLDPISDKTVTLVAMLDCALHYGFPWFVFGFCVFREILGVWVGSYLYFKRDMQGSPNMWGKFGVGAVALSVIWHVLTPYFKMKGLTGIWLDAWISAALIFFIFLAGMIAYGRTYWRIILHGKTKST